mgnify:CR=1 FL=1
MLDEAPLKLPFGLLTELQASLHAFDCRKQLQVGEQALRYDRVLVYLHHDEELARFLQILLNLANIKLFIRVFDQCPGDAQALFFSPGKSSAQLADLGVVSIRETANEIVGKCGLGRGLRAGPRPCSARCWW